MNLKFWKMASRIRELENELLFRPTIERLDMEIRRVEKAQRETQEVRQAYTNLSKSYERSHLSGLFSDRGLDAALSAAGDENPLWSSLLGALTSEYENEVHLALRPALGNEDAHYYRGRAAGLFEFRAALLTRRHQAQQPKAA